MARAEPVVLPACLSTAVFPAISAGAAKRTTCQNGKFQGMIASTVPSGSKATKLDAESDGAGSSARNPGAWSAK